MTKQANIAVYLQAIGAHYLGAHAHKVNEIALKLVYSKGSITLPYLFTPNFSNDGNPSANFVAGASSFMPIITVPQASASPATGLHFLSPDFTTVCARTTLEMPEEIEFAAMEIQIPVTSSEKPMIIHHPVLLNPNQSQYEITIPVPGLYLSATESKGNLAVFVRMMCGCPVTLGPPSSMWPASDFNVYANVLDNAGNTRSYSLSYDIKQSGNSLFTAPLLPDQKPIKLVTFTAIQKSTGNYGAVVQPG